MKTILRKLKILLAENISQPQQPQLPAVQPNRAEVLLLSYLPAILCGLHVNRKDQADHEDHAS